jgi:hypothetical protein
MPLPKRFLEDTVFRIKWLLNAYRNGNTNRTILFYPQFPSKTTVLHKIFTRLHYNITNNPYKGHCLTIYWDDTTWRKPNKLIEKLGKTEPVVNLNCMDISKSHVDEFFIRAFGYSCLVDCQTYTGLIVKKNEVNAFHDGVIVQGPVQREDGFVYQKLINNSIGDGLTADMRIPVINGIIPLIYIKYKPDKERFGLFKRKHHKLKSVEIHPPEALLSPDEISKLIQFCKDFHLDSGELDVLRNSDDGKIYIVDVNNTPTGPPYMNPKDKQTALQKMTKAFVTQYL